VKRAGWAWVGVALAVFIPALVLGVPPDPATSPWAVLPAQGWSGGTLPRLLGAAWVHGSAQHQQLNLLGLALLAALGWAWRVPRSSALAWLLAWPVGHLMLLLDPRLAWYVGASGVLHAGLGVLVVQLWARHRGLGAILALALGGKVLLDVAAGTPISTRVGLDIPIAPLAHLFGGLCGVAIAGFHHARFSPNGQI
jgi:rhomboid family GlyGly-CTERM serine protease